MKRGLIAWDKASFPPRYLKRGWRAPEAADWPQDLPALLVYTDVWRSNQARFLSNFMPYWNRSLLVIPRDGPPVLLCALSPRVYPWIKSVTIFEDIRPSPNLMQTLDQLCTEKAWKRIGVLDLTEAARRDLMRDLRGRRNAWMLPRARFVPMPDEGGTRDASPRSGAGARSTRRGIAGWRRLHRLRICRTTGARVPPAPARRIWSSCVTNGETPPALIGRQSRSEYCGHWVEVPRPLARAEDVAAWRSLPPSLASAAGSENLAGPHPYEPGRRIHLRVCTWSIKAYISATPALGTADL